MTDTNYATVVDCAGIIDGTEGGYGAGVGLLMRNGLIEGIVTREKKSDRSIHHVDARHLVRGPGFIDAQPTYRSVRVTVTSTDSSSGRPCGRRFVASTTSGRCSPRGSQRPES